MKKGHDENDEVDERMKKGHDENDEVDEWSIFMKKHHEVIANAHSKTKIMKNSSENIIDKTCLERLNHRQMNVRKEERWLQVPGGVYTSPTTKLNVSYEEVLTERGLDEGQAPGREKNRWNGKSQRDFADKSYDNSIDWRKANLTRMVVSNVFIETSMYENLVNDCVLYYKRSPVQPKKLRS